MDSKRKTITLLLTGTALLGTVALVVAAKEMNKPGLLAIAGESQPNSERTITITHENRLIGFKYNSSSTLACALFPMSEGLAYGIIETSQSQASVLEKNDEVVFSIWDNQTCYFNINPTFYDGKTITRESQTYTTVKFRHLTQIDITLDAHGDDRVTELKSTIDGYDQGSWDKIEEVEDSFIKYSWKYNDAGDNLPDSKKVKFEPKFEHSEINKAIWCTELVFHYTC